MTFVITVSTVVKSDLFACKLHAALYRAWKNRVKGRDWYDVVWFIRREIPLNLSYLSICMHNNGQLPKEEFLTPKRLAEFFSNRLETLDFESAKSDVQTFLPDPSQLREWSPDFFNYWFSQIKYT